MRYGLIRILLVEKSNANHKNNTKNLEFKIKDISEKNLHYQVMK